MRAPGKAPVLSDARKRALVILRDNPGIGVVWFAQRMWPESPARNTVQNCGNGSGHRGLAWKRSAACFLGTLRRAGLVYQADTTYHTKKGLPRMGAPRYYLGSKGAIALRAAGISSASEDAHDPRRGAIPAD